MANDEAEIKPDAHPQSLTPLGKYAWPQGETRQTLDHIFEKVKAELPWIARNEDEAAQKLHSIREQDLITATHERLSAILCACLDDTYLDWSRDDDAPSESRAFVHAPITQDILTNWANARGIPIVETVQALKAHTGGKCVVFPNLETILVRQHDKLHLIRETIAEIAKADIKVIVGCNSWAWRYLVAVTSIELSIIKQHTIPAFDGPSLAAVIKPVLREKRDIELFVAEGSDTGIFATDDDGALKEPYFIKLAKRSLGMPWVAIEMFFDDLHAADQDGDKQDDPRIWLRVPSVATLPSGHNGLICIALQNLLIHEPCSIEILSSCLPRALPSEVWSRLQSSGFVISDETGLRHNPSHYPAIRNALGTAGLNLDQL